MSQLETQALAERLAKLEQGREAEDPPDSLKDRRMDLALRRDTERGDKQADARDRAQPQANGRGRAHVARHRAESGKKPFFHLL